MRALAGGSVVLGLVVVLVSWDVSKRFIAVSPLPRIASFEVADRSPPASAAQDPSPPAGRGIESPDSASRALEPAPAEPVQSIARTSPELRQPISTPKLSAESPDLPVRQFPPGSKAHVAAIATAIDSEESRNMVAPLARLYFAYFDRYSDYEGLNYYIGERDAGMSLQAIADEFAGSLEFRLRYGTLDNAAFVDRIYRNVFDAPPDSANRAYWIAQLDSGVSRGQVMLAFSESSAFRTASSNEVFVTMAYAEALRREPDPAGFARWVRFLDAGNAREAVIAGLLTPRR